MRRIYVNGHVINSNWIQQKIRFYAEMVYVTPGLQQLCVKRSINLENNVSDLVWSAINKVYKYRKCVHARHYYKWLKREVHVEYFPSFRQVSSISRPLVIKLVFDTSTYEKADPCNMTWLFIRKYRIGHCFKFYLYL